MNKISKYIYLLGLGAIVLTSCNMNEAPTYAINVEEGDSLINSKGSLELMENGMLASYRSCQYGEFSQAEEIQCDGFNAATGYGNNYGGIHRSDDSFTADDYYTRDFWAYNYSAIKDYNIFLSSLEMFKPASASLQAEAKVCRGEAYFLRAASYLQLVRHYAKAYNASTAATELGVPVVLKYDQNEKPARKTVKEVYDQIKLDLDAAAADLATVKGSIASQKPTIDAVNALYARYYLDIADYKNAVIAAMNVIKSTAGYRLSSTAEEMTAEYVKDAGTEPIMQLYASLSENGSGTNSVYTQAAYHAGAGIVYFKPYFLPSGKLVDAYERTDLRFTNWFSGSYYTYLGKFTRGKFYSLIKYLGNPELRSGNTPNARQKVKPFMIGEMYLIAAEAYFKDNQADNAKTVLNLLQTARGASATSATMANIQNEWFKETVGEGLRLSCIKRWGEGFTARYGQKGAIDNSAIVAGDNFTGKSISADDFHLVWPIPTYEMKVNSNLKQNQGYGSN